MGERTRTRRVGSSPLECKRNCERTDSIVVAICTVGMGSRGYNKRERRGHTKVLALCPALIYRNAFCSRTTCLEQGELQHFPSRQMLK
jgi:hypothetical protein